MRISLFLILVFIGASSFAQEKKQFYLTLGTDVYKTDNRTLFDKTQNNFDINYFLTSKFSVGYGVEFRTGGSMVSADTYFTLRYYLVPKLFFKPRYVLVQNELDLAAGWSQPIGAKWRLEGIANYYTKQDKLGIRVGLGWIIN